MSIHLELSGSLVEILDLNLLGSYIIILMDRVVSHLVNLIDGVRTKFCRLVLTNSPILRLLAFVRLLIVKWLSVKGGTLDRVFDNLIQNG